MTNVKLILTLKQFNFISAARCKFLPCYYYDFFVLCHLDSFKAYKIFCVPGC